MNQVDREAIAASRKIRRRKFRHSRVANPRVGKGVVDGKATAALAAAGADLRDGSGRHRVGVQRNAHEVATRTRHSPTLCEAGMAGWPGEREHCALATHHWKHRLAAGGGVRSKPVCPRQRQKGRERTIITAASLVTIVHPRLGGDALMGTCALYAAADFTTL